MYKKILDGTWRFFHLNSSYVFKFSWKHYGYINKHSYEKYLFLAAKPYTCFLESLITLVAFQCHSMWECGTSFFFPLFLVVIWALGDIFIFNLSMYTPYHIYLLYQAFKFSKSLSKIYSVQIFYPQQVMDQLRSNTSW